MDVAGIGKRLREERERLQLSQEQLAAIAGTNRITPSRYEGGTHLPTIGFLAAVAQAGVDVGYVLDGKRNVVALSADDAALLGRAAAIVDARLAEHRLKPSEEVRGRWILQVLRAVQGLPHGGTMRPQSMEKLIEGLIT
jgi:transcriptional regulator with XRE-family HTH domain